MSPGSHDSQFARLPVRMRCGRTCLVQQNRGTRRPRNQDSAELGLRETRSPRNQDRGKGIVEQGFRGIGSVPKEVVKDALKAQSFHHAAIQHTSAYLQEQSRGLKVATVQLRPVACFIKGVPVSG